MPRIDKYEPNVGGTRAALYAAIQANQLNTVYGVGIDTNGLVRIGGAAGTGIVGVICPNHVMAAGEIIDVMTSGDIVEFGGSAGDVYYAAASTGVVSTTDTGTPVGFTVEGGRLVVRISTPSAEMVDVTAVQGDVTDLQTVVGDESAGLVKDVADLQDTVGDLTAATAVTGARDETEGAIKSLLTVLDTLGIIDDQSTAS